MALKKSEKRMLVFLGIVVVGAAVYQFVIYPASQEKPPEKPAGQTAQQGAQPGAPALNQTAAVPATGPVERKYREWKRDPFYARPVAVAASRGGGTKSAPKAPVVKTPVLSGILRNADGARAIIDNTVLAVGETKNGIHLVEIDGSTVICTKGNRTFTLQRSESR
ncbi:hypothetical protein JXO52_01330 [bacterium]|nr:hypothetical protein [bacterium]